MQGLLASAAEGLTDNGFRPFVGFFRSVRHRIQTVTPSYNRTAGMNRPKG